MKKKEDLEKFVIGLDFDGTVVTHDYPLIGQPLPYCIEVLKELQNQKHLDVKIILNTMRSDGFLKAAENYLRMNGIDVWASLINPEQGRWTSSTKCYAQLYIDDAAAGCPLIVDKKFSHRPYVDWLKVRQLLIEKGIIKIN